MKKSILLILVIFISLSCIEKDNSDKKQIESKYKSIEVPVFKINKENFAALQSLHFYHSVGGKPIKEETLVEMKYDKDFLEIKFECRNNPRIDQNYYTQDNSYLFHQEVFELFISNGKEAKENYLEIQLNPNNALFLGKVTNKYKSDNSYALELIDISTSGVQHSVEKDIKNETWKGYLKLPIALLQYPNKKSETVFRLNMFRIISNIDHTNEDWSANAENATFACWNSPNTAKPKFHAPEHFGYLVLE
ncbi:carbohydrate-binding family 9-like protein [Aquimarina muelleri]|uniref:Carbohydrate-binding domain-containing protein n=1 Tax=Aquimarina muelleri TaxID=279356 RepID=A0A918N4A0_9FLAO|nr:carbohydrate-binding family 9-like protein [Aquimarina muelleri]MCX2763318.1 carbohydrate-binding family 9-like protein [Aquimarina muelleri]GGX26267.1 hypothetical protein GCM10007384_29260 [Aquimarina muelleri]